MNSNQFIMNSFLIDYMFMQFNANQLEDDIICKMNCP